MEGRPENMASWPGLRSRKRVSVLGPGRCEETTAALAEELGGRLARAGFIVVCGGLGGVMRAVCKGVREAGGLSVGILPSEDRETANEFVDLAIATPLSHMRNYLVVLNGDMAVALQGEAGTLSELALAVKSGKPAVALGRFASLGEAYALRGIEPARDLDELMRLVEARLGQPAA